MPLEQHVIRELLLMSWAKRCSTSRLRAEMIPAGAPKRQRHAVLISNRYARTGLNRPNFRDVEGHPGYIFAKRRDAARGHSKEDFVVVSPRNDVRAPRWLGCNHETRGGR